GAHAALKKCLQTSTGNFESVHHKIILQVKSQAREIHAMISSECLRKIHDESIKASNATPDSSLDPCTGP
ncbi:5738_t:CDS:2, partial [Entrophospora sp. SA101]